MQPGKADIRQQMRRQRSALSAADCRALSLAASRRIRTQAWYVRSKTIAGYMPQGRELDIRPVLAHALRRGARTYLPRLSREDGLMQLCEFNAHSELPANHLGIPEPDGSATPLETLNLVLLPLVAFDLKGNRLGQGGGYYDRLLGNIGGWGKPLLVGVAYDFQRAEQLPCESWDVPLDAVVTPSAIHLFSKRLQAQG